MIHTIKQQLVSVCYFFQLGSHPLPGLISGTNIKSFLWYSLKLLKTYYHTDIEETLIEILVSHPSLISEYLVPLHSILPNTLLEYPPHCHRCVPCAFSSSSHAIHKTLKTALLFWKALLSKTLSNSLLQRCIQASRVLVQPGPDRDVTMNEPLPCPQEAQRICPQANILYIASSIPFTVSALRGFDSVYVGLCEKRT